MLSVLKEIGEKLNTERTLWAVGGSLMLNHYALVHQPQDIDLLVGLDDIIVVDEILGEIGQKKAQYNVGQYSTKYFYEYVVDGIDVDVMAGLAINHDQGTFNYVFDHLSISDCKNLEGVSIPLCALEDWYVLYQLIPGREMRVRAIEGYLKSNVVLRTDLLTRMLTLDLPDRVKANVKEMLEC